MVVNHFWVAVSIAGTTIDVAVHTVDLEVSGTKLRRVSRHRAESQPLFSFNYYNMGGEGATKAVAAANNVSDVGTRCVMMSSATASRWRSSTNLALIPFWCKLWIL